LLNPDNIVAARQIESAISPILADAPIIGHIDVMTKPGHMLALIATQLTRYRAEKTGGGHRIADNRNLKPHHTDAPHPRDRLLPQMPKIAGRLLKTSVAGRSRSHEIVETDPMFHTARSR
jgi:hypothetical protein